MRHRHDNRGTKYYSSDFDRNRRQQEVIKAVVDKAASLEGLTKIFNIMDVGAKNIHTDLSKDQIKGLAFDFKGFSASMVNALDNGAYWQGGYTFLEKDKLEVIRESLQSEMGMSGNVVAQLNNSPVLGSNESAVAASSSNTKPVKKKTTQSAASSAPKEKPPVEEVKEEPDTPEVPADVVAEGEATPPPDVVSPEQQQGQTTQTPPTQNGTVTTTPEAGTAPPPDIVPPSTQDASSTPSSTSPKSNS